MTHSNTAESDDALMARLAGGDRAAMGMLYARHAVAAKRSLCRLLPEATAAELEELLQDAFVALYEGASRYPREAGLERWIKGIAIKKGLHWRRKTWVRRKLLRRFGAPPCATASPAADSPERAAAMRREIAEAMRALPEDQRDVLILHAAEGLSGEEIAEALGIRRETVRTRLHRARQRLLDGVSEQALAELLGEEVR